MSDDLALEKLRQQNAELQRQVAERTAALKAANSELDAFVYSVSHDLRAPLRHITAFAGILERMALTRLDENERSSVEAIKEAADRVNQLIDDLLRLSRIARAEMNCTAVPLDDVVRQAQHDLVPEPGRRINWRIHPLPTIHADPTLVRHMFVNLFDNAVKFTRARDPAKITVGAEERADRWVIYVRDNGVGFEQKFAGRLFGVFQRLHSEREFEGTGIGLTIVRRIAARHGGEAWGEGRLNEGATFFVSFLKR